MTKVRLSLAAQALVYVASGVNHFAHTPFYVGIMPHHYRDPKLLVHLSGLAKMAAGVGLLVPATRRMAAGGIVAMLVVFLDVHQDMLRHADRFPGVPKWVLWVRLPLQFVLITWAGMYLREKSIGEKITK